MASAYEWLILKDFCDLLVAISGVLTSTRMYYVAFTIWFIRCFGLIGTLLCLNEALLIRYLIKVVLQKIIVMNDALIGTWIKLTNVVITLILSGIHSQSISFKSIVQHLTSGSVEMVPEGLNIKVVLILFIVNVILSIFMFLHVCIQKFKNRNLTPVIHINIPNPEANNQPIVINNQTYNNDLLNFFTYLTLVILLAITQIPTIITKQYNLFSTLANFFAISVNDCITIFNLTKNFIQTFALGFLNPLFLMLLSSELRPFLFSSLSCSQCTNNQIIDVNL